MTYDEWKCSPPADEEPDVEACGHRVGTCEGECRLDTDPAPAMEEESEMKEFKQYRRKQIAELRPYEPGEALNRVSITAADREAGSPRLGDMIARNPKNHDDQWLIAAAYFADNFEAVP